MNKLKHYLGPLRIELLFAAGAGTGLGEGTGAGGAGGGAGAGSGGGAGAGSGGAGTGGTGSGTGAGAGAGKGAGAGGAQDPAQLRAAYDKLKGDHEPWSKLGIKPEQVTQFQGVYQAVFTEAAEIGRDLGYTDDEIAEALQENPVATIDYLRNAAAKAQGGEGGQGKGKGGQEDELTQRMQDMIKQGLAPIYQQENVRRTDEANFTFERTVRSLISDQFKKGGLDVASVDAAELDLLVNATSEIFKYDDAGRKALKFEGKTAAIQTAFNEALNLLDKYYIARSTREGTRRAGGAGSGGGQGGQGGGAGAGGQGGGAGKKPTLDEMILDPSLINQKYKG